MDALKGSACRKDLLLNSFNRDSAQKYHSLQSYKSCPQPSNSTTLIFSHKGRLFPIFICLRYFFLMAKHSLRPPCLRIIYKFKMKKAAMIQHQVRQPRTLQIKILTEFEHFGVFEPKPDQILAKLFLYTRDSVFEGVLKKQAINSQLAWNENSTNTITECLNGTRTSIDIRFDEAKGKTSLICEIESGIKVTLFEITLREMVGVAPLQHMKRVFLSYRQLYSEQESKVKQQKDKITSEVREMQALTKRIEDQTQTEILHMKKNFIEIINRCKKSLRKHMKTGICEIVEEQEEVEEETKIKRRNIVRVNREALEKQACFRPMDIEREPQEAEEPEHDLESIFD